MALYVQTNNALPLSLDVQISVSSPQAQLRTDLSVLCIVGETLGFLPNANRIRYYRQLSDVLVDFSSSSNVGMAARDFFAQSPAPPLMAIAEAYVVNQPSQVVAGTLSAADIAAIAAITTGSMKLSLAGTATDVTGMNFTGCTTLAAIAAIIQTRITAATLAATCSVVTYPGGGQRIVIASTGTGDTATNAFPIAAGSGVFAATALRMTAATNGAVLAGYTVGTIADELANIQSAANASSRFIYGWCLTADFRTVATQALAAAWVLAQTKGFMCLVTNDLGAYDPTVTTDLASVVNPTNNKRVEVIFHDAVNYYPDVSILAYMLAVNYQLQDATVTAKFKQLPGIPTVQLNSNQWTTLEGKGYNVLSLTGTVPVFRDGSASAPATYMDTVINIDNFVEDLGINIYNVFLMNKKVRGRTGQLQLVGACNDTGNQYIYNGSFESRDVADSSVKSGVTTVPAVQTIPTPLAQNSAANRAARIAPPIQMIVQPSEIFHSVAINVSVVN
jgi:hypothetical protein